MKNFAIKVTWLTTIYLVVFIILCQAKVFFPLIAGLYLVGVCLMLFMIYSVLHDQEYKTTKRFKDWYGDNPKKKFVH